MRTLTDPPVRRAHAVLIPLILAAVAQLAPAQPRDRLAGRIDNRKYTVLRGSRNPRIDSMTDQGPVDDGQRIAGLSLRFRPTAQQAVELDQLLTDQQNPVSPRYHAWLTPEEFGDRFGLTSNDFGKVTDWLSAQGFQVDGVARSRTHVIFSGSAAQVRVAFRTALHRFRDDRGEHYANLSEIAVPADLAALIYTVKGLDNFRISRTPKLRPMYQSGSGKSYAGPGDLATIYNVNPLYQKGIDGSGQKIVVIGQTAFKMADVRSFRQKFSLPANDPQMILIPGFPDPGFTDDLMEAEMDVEIAGATAPKAAILFVYSEHTYYASQYAVDQNLAPVISHSYGVCEKAFLTHLDEIDAWRSIAKQANAQGMTWVSSSGDAGPADCETQQVDKAGINGSTVDVPAVFPEITGVGGTEFNEGGGAYWSTANGSTNSSALSYIPEKAWNDTAADGTLAATGGGASAIIAKPTWQKAPGVPSANARFVPDIAFTASWDHDAYFINFNGEFWGAGGTSAATPYFAGVLALLNQSVVGSGLQSRPGLGNINPKLYEIAQSTPSAFHDVVSGNNIIPCKTGSANCTTGTYGFSAGPGFDLTTGLGSLDVTKFVAAWTGGASTPSVANTTTTVTANPSVLAANGSTVVTATVKAATGSAAPTGPVYFSLGQTALGNADLSGSSGAATASLTVKASQLAAGANTLTAWYGGASSFLSSTGTVTVTVSAPAQNSNVTATAQPSPVYRQSADADGFQWFYTVKLAESAGTPTKLTGFSIDGYDYSAQIALFFGSVDLPANGALTAPMRYKGITSLPADLVFAFSGVDASGQKWTRQITVTFVGDSSSPSLSLSSSPGTVLRSATPDDTCDAGHPYRQQLNLQERSGTAVRLTKFIAGGNDFSSQIVNWFGSPRLAAFGTLHADFCWSLNSVPSTLDYEVAGVDRSGRIVSATLQVTFKGAAENPGALSVSKSSIALGADLAKSTSATLNVNVPANEQWILTAIQPNQKSPWLSVTPQSGAGPSQVTLTASAASMYAGVYSATLIFQSQNTAPQFVNVPVTFTVGAASDMSIAAAQNSASFQPVLAPGMLATLFGKHLAVAAKLAEAAPLPTSLEGVSVTVNGVTAPLWYVSPDQINLQIPYETPLGPVIVAVNNLGRSTSTIVQISAVAPGIFTNGGALVPTATASRGSAVVLYLTGDGEQTPMLESGAPPAAGTPLAQLPKPRVPLTVTVGGVKADVAFVGNPWLVGTTQVNFTVPLSVPAGPQSVVVTQGGVSSAAATLIVQ